MRTLIIGGTGTIGSQLIPRLLRWNINVRVLTRDPKKAKRLPQGVGAITGDLLDPGTVRAAFNDVEAVFMVNAASVTETHEGLMAVNGMRMSGVRRVVYISVQDADKAPHLPHYGSKLAIETAIKSSGIPYTILRPNNFYQNDYWFKDALVRRGVYPQPIGDIGLSRVDVRDIAEAAAIVLIRDGHEGVTYNIPGPEVHTGQSTAAAWARALARPIVYGGNDLDSWEQKSGRLLPPWMVYDLRMMYEYFLSEGFRAKPSDVERLTALLDRPLRTFQDFAYETAKLWQAG